MAFDGTLKFDTALDEKGFQSGLDGLGSLAQKGLDAVKGLAEKAGETVLALGKNAIQSGKSFETGMSQIQATLGFSVADVANNINQSADIMEQLTQKAEEMGRKTAFSATQAADGLNTIAMAGYDANDAVLMIENGLNLASAGHLQLDEAMKYVTGSMKGFVKEAEKLGDAEAQSAYYSDIIAKGATMAATDVNQLGLALSGVAATANGYNQTAQATEVALLRLAEQGIIGSEAITHLNQLMSDLYTPTEQAKKAFERLGVSVYDETTGMQKDVNTVVDEINAKLEKIRTASPEGIAEAADLENVIFGQRGQKAFDKMIVSSAEKVQSFYDGLEYTEDGAKGSAAKQAEAMLNNLNGDMTLLASAAEGLYNSLYKSMNGTLRELVQLANGYVTELTEAFENGGFEGLAKKAGDVLGDAITKISDYLPDIVKIGSSAVTSLFKGISKNAGTVAQTGIQMGLELIKGIGHILAEIPAFVVSLVQALADGISQNQEKILITAKTILNSLSNSLTTNLEPLMNAGMSILEMLVQVIVDHLDSIIQAGLQLIQTLCETLLNGDNLEKLLDAGIKILWAVTNAIIDNLDTIIDIAIRIIEFLTTELLKPDNLEKLLSAGGEILEKLMNAVVENLDPLLLACENIIDTLADTLITPENMEKLLVTGGQLLGKLVEGLWYISGHLLGWAWEVAEDLDDALFGTGAPDWESLGWQMVEGILSGMTGTDFKIADWLDDFGDNWVTGIKEVFGIHSPSKVMKDEVGEYLALGIGEGFTECMNTVTEQATKAIENMTADFPKYGEQSGKQFLTNLSGNLKQVPMKVSEFLNSSLNFAQKWGNAISENGKNSAKHFLDTVDNSLKQLPDAVANIGRDALKNVTDWGNSLHENGLNLAQNFVNGIMNIVDTLPEKMLTVGENLIEGFWNGVTNAGDWLKNQISNFADTVVENFKDAFGIQSPSKIMRDSVGRYLAEGIGVGFNAHLPEVENDAVKAFSGLRLPEIPVDFDEISEIPKMEMESLKIPELPKLGLQLPQMPEFSDISIKIDDIPKLPELGLNLPDVPELNLTIPELQLPEIPDIVLKIGDIPKLPKLQLPEIPANFYGIDRDALQAFRSQMATPVNIAQSSPTSNVVNNYYQQTTNNNTSNIGQNSQQGDIIIPVSIGGQEIETFVIDAIQLANLRSGGATI